MDGWEEVGLMGAAGGRSGGRLGSSWRDGGTPRKVAPLWITTIACLSC